MAILQTSDFASGQYSIPQNQYSDLQNYINEYEKFYLVRLLGVALYDLFIADLTAPTPQTPQTAPYQAIFNPFQFDEGNCIYISEGIKKMLIQFVYFHYIRENQVKKTISGNVIQVSEIAENKPFYGNIIDAYNKGVKNLMNIQWYIEDNSSVYTTFNGQAIHYTSGI